MRIWLFDRVGGIGSTSFNIHKDPKRFIRVILGFAVMGPGALGHDMTIQTTDNGTRFVMIGRKKFFLLDKVFGQPVVSGRATVCWRAQSNNDPNTIYVIKDSWRNSTQNPEGPMLKKVTETLRDTWEDGRPLIVEHFCHGDVKLFNGQTDDVANIRKGLEPTLTVNHITKSFFFFSFL
jgi:hypothetical protein